MATSEYSPDDLLPPLTQEQKFVSEKFAELLPIRNFDKFPDAFCNVFINGVIRARSPVTTHNPIVIPDIVDKIIKANIPSYVLSQLSRILATELHGLHSKKELSPEELVISLQLRKALALITNSFKSSIKDAHPGFRLVGTQSRPKFNFIDTATSRDAYQRVVTRDSLYIGVMPSAADLEELIEHMRSAQGSDKRPLKIIVICCQEEGEQVDPATGEVICKYGFGENRTVFTPLNPNFMAVKLAVEKKYQGVEIIHKWITPGGIRDGGVIKAYTDEALTVGELMQFFDNFKAEPNTDMAVLSHCFGGIGRSAAVAIAYLTYCHNCTLNYAVNLVAERRGTGKGLEEYREGQRTLVADLFAQILLDSIPKSKDASEPSREFTREDVELMCLYCTKGQQIEQLRRDSKKFCRFELELAEKNMTEPDAKAKHSSWSGFWPFSSKGSEDVPLQNLSGEAGGSGRRKSCPEIPSPSTMTLPI